MRLRPEILVVTFVIYVTSISLYQWLVVHHGNFHFTLIGIFYTYHGNEHGLVKGINICQILSYFSITQLHLPI